MALHALLWDVDGTLAETERDGHRRAFNRAFAEAGLPLHWDADAYGSWLGISGGAERIRAALQQHEGTEPSPERVTALQAAKQRHYAALMGAGDLRLRPGVTDLIREASAAGLEQVIVTTSGRPAVEALMGRLLGGLADAFGFWVCGEDVRRKKPDPEAYLQALERLGRRPDQVICLEDSPAGLAAATAAGLPCLVSLSHYASREDPESFRAARAVVSELGPAAAWCAARLVSQGGSRSPIWNACSDPLTLQHTRFKRLSDQVGLLLLGVLRGNWRYRSAVLLALLVGFYLGGNLTSFVLMRFPGGDRCWCSAWWCCSNWWCG